MTLLTPVMCYQGITYLIISRVLQGIFSGMSFPSANAIYSTWSPPLEVRINFFGIKINLTLFLYFAEITIW
jgi:MFS family permease